MKETSGKFAAIIIGIVFGIAIFHIFKIVKQFDIIRVTPEVLERTEKSASKSEQKVWIVPRISVPKMDCSMVMSAAEDEIIHRQEQVEYIDEVEQRVESELFSQILSKKDSYFQEVQLMTRDGVKYEVKLGKVNYKHLLPDDEAAKRLIEIIFKATYSSEFSKSTSKDSNKALLDSLLAFFARTKEQEIFVRWCILDFSYKNKFGGRVTTSYYHTTP